jgi:hypothetical protein
MNNLAKPTRKAWKKQLSKLTGGTLGMTGRRQQAPLQHTGVGRVGENKTENRGGQKGVF